MAEVMAEFPEEARRINKAGWSVKNVSRGDGKENVVRCKRSDPSCKSGFLYDPVFTGIVHGNASF